MSIYDAVMKGPPKWFVRTIALLCLIEGCIQFGMYLERSTQTATAVKARLDEKDRQIDRLKIALNDAQYDLDVERRKLSIILCESGARHAGVWGDGGRSYGICQFQYRTFAWMRKEAGRPALRWRTRGDQLWLLDWALRHGYGKYWTCYKGGRP